MRIGFGARFRFDNAVGFETLFLAFDDAVGSGAHFHFDDAVGSLAHFLFQ
jgi:hypothetical protein